MGRVCPQQLVLRDGLQGEARFVPSDDKRRSVSVAPRRGRSKIDVTSFVLSKAIPMLVDADDMRCGIERVVGVQHRLRVPNLRGA